MAKKQEASAKKPKAAPRTKVKPAKAENAEAAAPAEAKKRAPKPAAAAQREITNEAIGATAGQVWSLLAVGGGNRLAALQKTLSAADDEVLLALGWLAREDKLAFDTSGRTLTVSLR